MDYLDAVFLARVQFAFTVTFHIIFPAFTIGLASWLAVVEFRWLQTGDPIYRSIYKHWVKVFAVAFGLGVVSGVVMSYQFGTNWSGFSDQTANVIGPLLKGMEKPIQIVQMGADVNEIINAAAFAAHDSVSNDFFAKFA